MTKPIIICEKCGHEAHKQRNGDHSLCQRCHDNKMKRLWKETLPKGVKCFECGQERPTVLLDEHICQSCYTKRKNGVDPCSSCGKEKIIANIEHHLCKHCYADLISPKNLHTYLDRYETPFPQNKGYLDLLSETIDWGKVTEKTERRFRSIGKFLSKYALSYPLTWEAIEEALPPLSSSNRYNTKLVRSCLNDIGYLLVERGLLESRANYVTRRRSLQPIAKAPEYFKSPLLKYKDWLEYDKYSPSSVRSSLYSIVYFLSWCAGRGLTSLTEVHPLTVEDYQQTLYWKWTCSVCQHSTQCEPWEEIAPRRCLNPKCRVTGTYERRKRNAQSYIRTQMSNISNFFRWAEYHQFVSSNPVQCKIRDDEQKVTHYDEQVFGKLCAYLESPGADAEEAIALYLIFFHAFKVTELRLAQIPSLVDQDSKRNKSPQIEDYLVIAPHPRPRANNAGKRPSLRIDFPAEAVHWLKPILERLIKHNTSIIQDLNNQYLFVSMQSARHNQPVSKEYIRRLVSKATQRVLKAKANASTLRRTAGVIFTDECPRRGSSLVKLGWGPQRANNYTYMRRRVVHPRPT